MKKLFFVIVLAVFVNLSSSAQFEIKGLAGLNWATFSGSDQEVAAKMGYQFGGGVLIGNKFYVEPGIQFVRSSSTFTANSSDIEFSQNSVKIPVYAGYHLLGAEDKPLALRIFAGPTVNIPGKIAKGDDQIDKDHINKAIWSVDGGLGLDIFLFFVEASYEYSFNDYFTEGAPANGKHGAFILNAGVHIDF
jgi:hypothetical protein